MTSGGALQTAADVVAALAVTVWCHLALGHGRSWRTSVRLPPVPAGTRPRASVVAIVPARDEADVLPHTLPTLLAQEVPGRFRVVVVDDDSSDGTGALAASLGAEVVRGTGPPPGWTGKVAAMAAGVTAAGPVDYLLFTDADVAHPPGSVQALVAAAEADRRDLVSLMVRLRTTTRWERVVVPAFVYFFAQLYPFDRVNGPGRTAAAAGGCMLVRREALAAAGGLAMIRGALIDDVALARQLGRRGRIWLGLSREVVSVRPYPHLADLWTMVTRSAYTQLRCSPVLLAATVLGLALTYLVPPAAVLTGLVSGDALLGGLGAAAWAVMAATWVPMLRHHGVAAAWAPALPAVAALYLAMTLDSARRHRAGRGGTWKGRVGARDVGPDGA